LTNAELLHYAHMQGYDKLPVNWIVEIIKRFEALLDNNK